MGTNASRSGSTKRPIQTSSERGMVWYCGGYISYECSNHQKNIFPHHIMFCFQLGLLNWCVYVLPVWGSFRQDLRAVSVVDITRGKPQNSTRAKLCLTSGSLPSYIVMIEEHMSIDVDQFRADSSPTRWCPIGSFKVEVMSCGYCPFLSSPLERKVCWRMPPVSCYCMVLIECCLCGLCGAVPCIYTHTHIYIYTYIYITIIHIWYINIFFQTVTPSRIILVLTRCAIEVLDWPDQ
jgi:hypothetical protein